MIEKSKLNQFYKKLYRLFSGNLNPRLNRTQFLITQLCLTAFITLLLFDADFVMRSVNSNILLTVFWSIALPLSSLLFIWLCFTCVFRFQDCNFSGWWFLLYAAILFFIDQEVITGLMPLFLLLFPGTKGDNKFGKIPSRYFRSESRESG